MKEIEFSNHSLEQCLERGVKKEEVIEAVRSGESEPAKKGRTIYKKNFDFSGYWNDKFYMIKQVAPLIIEEEEKIVVITVFSYYF